MPAVLPTSEGADVPVVLVDPGPAPVSGWGGYLRTFHAERAGITEDLLRRCVDGAGSDPYQWLLQPMATGVHVVDVGCGSGPVGELCTEWVGVDLSRAELVAGRRRGRTRVVEGRAEALPFASAAVPQAVAAMSLMVVEDPAAALREVARILRPAGRLVLLLPDRGPLSGRDRVRYGILLSLLGQRAAPFPQPDLTERLPGLLATAGFRIAGDDRRRFACPMATRADAHRFLDSLYLPDVPSARRALAGAAMGAWGRAPLGIPLRRVVAERDPRAGPVAERRGRGTMKRA